MLPIPAEKRAWMLHNNSRDKEVNALTLIDTTYERLSSVFETFLMTLQWSKSRNTMSHFVSLPAKQHSMTCSFFTFFLGRERTLKCKAQFVLFGDNEVKTLISLIARHEKP